MTSTRFNLANTKVCEAWKERCTLERRARSACASRTLLFRGHGPFEFRPTSICPEDHDPQDPSSGLVIVPEDFPQQYLPRDASSGSSDTPQSVSVDTTQKKTEEGEQPDMIRGSTNNRPTTAAAINTKRHPLEDSVAAQRRRQELLRQKQERELESARRCRSASPFEQVRDMLTSRPALRGQQENKLVEEAAQKLLRQQQHNQQYLATSPTGNSASQPAGVKLSSQQDHQSSPTRSVHRFVKLGRDEAPEALELKTTPGGIEALQMMTDSGQEMLNSSAHAHTTTTSSMRGVDTTPTPARYRFAEHCSSPFGMPRPQLEGLPPAGVRIKKVFKNGGTGLRHQFPHKRFGGDPLNPLTSHLTQDRHKKAMKQEGQTVTREAQQQQPHQQPLVSVTSTKANKNDDSTGVGTNGLNRLGVTGKSSFPIATTTTSVKPNGGTKNVDDGKIREVKGRPPRPMVKVTRPASALGVTPCSSSAASASLSSSLPSRSSSVGYVQRHSPTASNNTSDGSGIVPVEKRFTAPEKQKPNELQQRPSSSAGSRPGSSVSSTRRSNSAQQYQGETQRSHVSSNTTRSGRGGGGGQHTPQGSAMSLIRRQREAVETNRRLVDLESAVHDSTLEQQKVLEEVSALKDLILQQAAAGSPVVSSS